MIVKEKFESITAALEGAELVFEVVDGINIDIESEAIKNALATLQELSKDMASEENPYDPSDLQLGLYEIFWKGEDGGSSLAAVGQTYNGTRWLAPTNWTCAKGRAFTATTNWTTVASVKLILGK